GSGTPRRCPGQNGLHAESASRPGLVVPVCWAVRHAQQKGATHRDLEPSNILVALRDGGPVPRVIDRGVARPGDGDKGGGGVVDSGGVGGWRGGLGGGGGGWGGGAPGPALPLLSPLPGDESKKPPPPVTCFAPRFRMWGGRAREAPPAV